MRQVLSGQLQRGLGGLQFCLSCRDVFLARAGFEQFQRGAGGFHLGLGGIGIGSCRFHLFTGGELLADAASHGERSEGW
ncbi:hypothetical protein [Thiolapillus sp.]|uniref:hypothetical protein n=1 Tax=Thiolapillus sp. TaxID=2017437 RepID=UPI003AF8732C